MIQVSGSKFQVNVSKMLSASSLKPPAFNFKVVKIDKLLILNIERN